MFNSRHLVRCKKQTVAIRKDGRESRSDERKWHTARAVGDGCNGIMPRMGRKNFAAVGFLPPLPGLGWFC